MLGSQRGAFGGTTRLCILPTKGIIQIKPSSAVIAASCKRAWRTRVHPG